MDLKSAVEDCMRVYGVEAEPAERVRMYAEPGDFEDPEGILVCGFCGRPKEHRCGGMVFPVVHDHQLRDLSSHRETAEERARRIEANRSRCFAGEFCEEGERDRFELADPDSPFEALQECRSFVATFADQRKGRQGRGMILYGPVGRGKTFLAGCVCNALLDEGWRCLMTSTRRIRGDIERSYGSQNDVVERLCRNDLVVLDDLFRDRDTEAGRETVFTVVDALYKMRVPVIVTTNMRSESLTFPSDADQPVVERLKERCHRIAVEGPNKRQSRAL